MKMLKQIFAALMLCFCATFVIAADAATGRGLVNRVDVAAGVVNINHEPIPALKWPSMSMDFKVANKQSLAAVKPGQTVTFGLVKDAKLGYLISHIEPVNK
jgi:Cu/Ag efflux protein CusF